MKENATIKKQYYFMGELISEAGIKYNRVDYRTLSKCFDAVLCNDITKLFYNVLNNEYIEPYQENGQIDNQEQIEELEEQIEELEEQIEELEELEEHQQEQIKTLQNKIEELEEQIEELEEQQEQEPEIYQYYIISDHGADILKRYTNEIVYYIDYLDIYIWGVTHWGTSWDYVLTDTKPASYKLIYNDYIIIADYEIIEEIAKNTDSMINWSNFNDNDIFYSNDGTAYTVEISHKYKNVYLTLK